MKSWINFNSIAIMKKNLPKAHHRISFQCLYKNPYFVQLKHSLWNFLWRTISLNKLINLFINCYLKLIYPKYKLMFSLIMVHKSPSLNCLNMNERNAKGLISQCIELRKLHSKFGFQNNTNIIIKINEFY
jgi:hypothetical protein